MSDAPFEWMAIGMSYLIVGMIAASLMAVVVLALRMVVREWNPIEALGTTVMAVVLFTILFVIVYGIAALIGVIV